MTNEELDRARVKEAQRLFLDGSDESPTILIAARLAREGWTPPVTVDPDLAEAERLAYAWHVNEIKDVYGLALAGIKRGRALAAAEAKPVMVWVKHDGSNHCPVDPDSHVWIRRSVLGRPRCKLAGATGWPLVTHYAVITPPAEDVA